MITKCETCTATIDLDKAKALIALGGTTGWTARISRVNHSTLLTDAMWCPSCSVTKRLTAWNLRDLDKLLQDDLDGVVQQV